MCKFMEIVTDERRGAPRSVAVLELLVVGPQLIVASTLLLHVGQRFFKSLQPSVEIPLTRASFLTGEAPFTPFTRCDVLYSDNGGL